VASEAGLMLWDVASEARQGIHVGHLPPSSVPFR
jgi:hypothetical protein